VSNNLVERLQMLSDTLAESIDHIETLEAIVGALQKSDPEAVDMARAVVAAAKKDQHF
jgi:hypothetical protein